MPTGTHNEHPFSPGPTLTREQLLAYAKGRSTPQEQFLVELQLEHDPLLAEAIEGLSIPGAAESVKQLDRYRPGNGFPGGFGAITILIAIMSIGVLVFHATPADELVQIDPFHSIEDGSNRGPVINEQHDVFRTEGVIEVKEPEGLIKAAIRNELPAEAFQRESDLTPILSDRSIPVDQLEPIAVEPETIRTSVEPRPATPTRRPSGLRLHYLHDLKLIHPKELYPYEPAVELSSGNLTADRSDRDQVNILEEDLRSIDYLTFMEEALSHFDKNDPAKCLEEMEHLLDQHPDDLNALFYAGLCNFQLKNFKAARRQLDLAAKHRYDVFREEAVWYRAQTLEALGEIDIARREYRRIIEADGFYAERARARMK